MSESQSDSSKNTEVLGGPPKTPRWVKLGAVAAIIVVALVVLVLKMGDGQHGPGRHTPGGDNPGGHTPPAQYNP